MCPVLGVPELSVAVWGWAGRSSASVSHRDFCLSKRKDQATTYRLQTVSGSGVDRIDLDPDLISVVAGGSGGHTFLQHIT